MNTPKTREKAALNILNLVEENDYDGVNLDLEMLPPRQRSNYTSFIREVSSCSGPGLSSDNLGIPQS